jgi:Helitron helicase-like domain at N-terminus
LRGERAARVAKDPVAAADFYQFCVKTIFEDLFGWDYEKRCFMNDGGILGKLKAHLGVSELTNRGGLHGHFLLWLLYGLSPKDVHVAMEDDQFKSNFFDYWESCIHYHLPEVDIVNFSKLDPTFEPRAERPMVPPPINFQDDSFNLGLWKT